MEQELYELLEAIKRAAERRGATFRQGVGRLDAQPGDGKVVVSIDGERRDSGPVVLTTGAWWLGAAVAGSWDKPAKPDSYT